MFLSFDAPDIASKSYVYSFACITMESQTMLLRRGLLYERLPIIGLSTRAGLQPHLAHIPACQFSLRILKVTFSTSFTMYISRGTSQVSLSRIPLKGTDKVFIHMQQSFDRDIQREGGQNRRRGRRGDS